MLEFSGIHQHFVVAAAEIHDDIYTTIAADSESVSTLPSSHFRLQHLT